MGKRIVLLVEDDEGQVELFEQQLKEYHKAGNNAVTFEPMFAKTVNAANKLLETMQPECAIVDLRIPQTRDGKATEAGGNAVALSVIREYGIPAAIHSALLHSMSEDLKVYPVICFDREKDSYRKTIEALAEQEPLMATLAAARKEINRGLAQVFAGAIWPRWKSYVGGIGDAKKLTQMVTRQIVGHLSEVMGIEGEENPEFHHLECYFNPPIRDDKPHTGDLFQMGEEVWIVVTPRCDMATGRAKDVLIALCDDVPGWAKKLRTYKNAATKKDKEGPKKALNDWRNQQLPASQHFLPPCGDKGPWLVNFKTVKAVPHSELVGALGNRVASLTQAFIPNLSQRFGAFVSRPGQPNLDMDHF